MTFKSSPLNMIIGFLKLLIGPALVSVAILTASDGGNYMNVFYAVVAAAPPVSAYFSFYRYNISVEVTDHAVRFFRGKRVYITLSRREYAIDPQVTKLYYNGIPTQTLRILRAAKSGERPKNYKCHHFDKATFETLTAQLKI